MTTPPGQPRLRFAPSPTGYLHVGGARTALFNWLFARKFGGQFLLRIEDTDKARSTDASTRAIFDGLTWLGLDWDEEVVYQGANLERHRADALRLLDSGAAYRDFTPQHVLDERRRTAEERGEIYKYRREWAELPLYEAEQRLERGDPYVVRFRVPDGVTEWDDLVHERISFANKDIEDFVILRSDGTPIYNHAVVSDDIAMRITLVMRGDDHISNTPKQIMLYEALGKPVPQFAHLPMIHGLDGKKLSKRHGATAVGDYQHEGLLPQAMLNFLALLGWSPGGDREVMTLARDGRALLGRRTAAQGSGLRSEEARVDERSAHVAHAAGRARAHRNARCHCGRSRHGSGARKSTRLVSATGRPSPCSRPGRRRHREAGGSVLLRRDLLRP